MSGRPPYASVAQWPRKPHIFRRDGRWWLRSEMGEHWHWDIGAMWYVYEAQMRSARQGTAHSPIGGCAIDSVTSTILDRNSAASPAIAGDSVAGLPSQRAPK